ncbi:hypothetical protein TUBRATIS_21710 [Tubulinosema ratisbonensis]|uniref:Uncharacterized protein n=1 Tax=Tubulinosema ratisbonensis TaxID=291195 RepID=A0A437AJR7_9MICR|nr:hypothetical protein TUBRATIS_21710 [Tubulinosema ratisbonensis]
MLLYIKFISWCLCAQKRKIDDLSGEEKSKIRLLRNKNDFEAAKVLVRLSKEVSFCDTPSLNLPEASFLCFTHDLDPRKNVFINLPKATQRDVMIVIYSDIKNCILVEFYKHEKNEELKTINLTNYTKKRINDFIENNVILHYVQESTSKEKIQYSYHIWDNLDLKELAKNFQSKPYFNLNYFFDFFYKSPYKRSLSCLTNDIIYIENRINLMIKEKIYDQKTNYFCISGVKYVFTGLRDLHLKMHFNYLFLQEEIRKLFSFFNGSNKKQINFLRIYILPILLKFPSTIQNCDTSNLEKSIYDDFIKLDNHPGLRFLFPELEKIFSLLVEINDIHFYKRAIYGFMIIQLRLSFFKQIIKDEIMREIQQNNEIDLLNCEYFTYFVLSSKFILQSLILLNCNFNEIQNEKFYLCNYLYFLQVNEQKKFLKFNTFFLFNIFDLSISNSSFNCEYPPCINNSPTMPKTLISINFMSLTEALKIIFDEKTNLIISIKRISGEEVILDSETSIENLRSIFNENLNKILIEEFS